MIADVISLSDLSDEPGEANMFGNDFSPRLKAVLDRMPNNSTGTATRVQSGLRNAGIFTLAALQDADDYVLGRKHLGPVSRAAIDAALAVFGLYRVGQNPPVVVRDGASADEAHCQRLRKWIEERMEIIDGEFLDGREPSNKRTWSMCEEKDCEREAGHPGYHCSRAWNAMTGSEELHEWEAP